MSIRRAHLTGTVGIVQPWRLNLAERGKNFKAVLPRRLAAVLPRRTRMLEFERLSALWPRPHNTKSAAVEPAARETRVTARRSKALGTEPPRAAAQNSAAGIAARRSGTTIDRCAFIAVIPDILDPLCCIAVHIVQTKRVRRE